MKTHKLWLTWLKHREAIIILFCFITVMFLALAGIEVLLNLLFDSF